MPSIRDLHLKLKRHQPDSQKWTSELKHRTSVTDICVPLPICTRGSDLSENAPGAWIVLRADHSRDSNTALSPFRNQIPALPRAAQERSRALSLAPLTGECCGTTPTFLLNSFYFAYKYSLNQRQHKQFHSLVNSTFTRNKSLVFSPCSSEYLGRRGVGKNTREKKAEDSVQQGAEPRFLADQALR